MHDQHGFKNGTGSNGSIGSTRNWPSVRSGYDKKPKISLKPINSKNRLVQPENRKPAWSNRLMTGWGFFTSPLKLRRFSPQ